MRTRRGRYQNECEMPSCTACVSPCTASARPPHAMRIRPKPERNTRHGRRRPAGAERHSYKFCSGPKLNPPRVPGRMPGKRRRRA